MFDTESFLQVMLTGSMLPLIVLVFLVLGVVIALVVMIVRLRTWHSYEAWEARKRRHIRRYADRTMLHAGESLDLYRKFHASWKALPPWSKLWWMITGVA